MAEEAKKMTKTITKFRESKTQALENIKLRGLLEEQIKRSNELALKLKDATTVYSIQMSVNFRTKEEATGFVDHMMLKADKVEPLLPGSEQKAPIVVG